MAPAVGMHKPCQKVRLAAAAAAMHKVRQRYRREESTAERADRQWNELMQELRVTQTGVQVLVGFLFTVVFSSRFKELTADQRTLYIITLVLGAGATAVLIAPVSFHRILFAKRMKPELVRAANVLTLIGLGLLMCTISAALLLVFEFLLHGSVIAWLAAGVITLFMLLWYLVPLGLRLRRNLYSEREDTGAGPVGVNAEEAAHAGEREPTPSAGSDPHQ